MKELYLIRHAKSSWEDPFQDDFKRPLNRRGQRDAPGMGKRLKEMQIYPGLILSSPAERALSTSVIIAEKIGYPVNQIHTDQRLYHAGENQLLNIVRAIGEGEHKVMIVGHNPGLTDFANQLSHELVTDNIPTCGIVGLSVPVQSWNEVRWEKGDVLFFDFPKNAGL